MADQAYPQIPTTVWWGVRQLLQRSPKAKFDESMLSASLSVQPVASKQYFLELKRIGLFDDEGRGTVLANRWRMDDTYTDAVDEIARESYPATLVTIAPPGEADRKKVVNWFMTQGLGEGSAKNKAATYLLVTSLQPNSAPLPPGRSDSPRASKARVVEKSTGTTSTHTSSDVKQPEHVSTSGDPNPSSVIPLNLNVQIHISADASTDQIETIFSAMRKYLRND